LADGDEADRLLPDTDHPHPRTVPIAGGRRSRTVKR
jgi:hypothetical protein